MKMWNYVVISVFLAVLFELGGMSVSAALLEKVGITLEAGTAGFKSSTFWIALVALLTAGGVGGIAIGFITKSPSENYVILPFIIAEILFFSAVMLGIMSVASGMGWLFYLTLLIIAPLIVGFGMAAYEHFRGTD